jgi:Helix-turn-helix domain
MPAHRAEPTQTDMVALVVKPSAAMAMLSVSRTRLYELLNTNQLESFRDGSSRKITVSSIRAYIARHLAEAA